FFLGKGEAISHSDLEVNLHETDRVTLYRTLKTFEESGIIHKVVDGTGVARYAICHDECGHQHHKDNHAHFHCDKCDKTTCLAHVDIPQVNLPEGYTKAAAHMIINGICGNCA
ncbi:MAG: Fur family transcriptional regulator, partial [Saprospiraceae bacterium]